MKKIILSFVLILPIMVCALRTNQDVFALESSSNVYEQKVYCNTTLEDDFDGSSVMVLLDKSISEVNKIHSKEFFAGVEIESIDDLSTMPARSLIVKTNLIKGSNAKKGAGAKRLRDCG